uniref:Carboxypeptidase n=1 Tax=Nyssomyia neivai TaxID=330878 RepID=A0A1L8DPK9_9DIPT
MLKETIGILLLASLALARVGFGPGEQDWGYVDVREGAHMFYWLYYTTANVEMYTDRPLVIWLQGGPGASSTGYGNFEELGPLTLEGEERTFSWVKNYNVLFIDNPVGSGFSYVDNQSYLTKTNEEIANDLVAFMKEFYRRHPEFQLIDLHIFSESYGGKMAAEFAYILDKEIKLGNIVCQLKSAGLGDSWISPIDSMYSWAPFLWDIGAVDRDGERRVAAATELTRIALDEGRFVEATNLWGYTEQVVSEVTYGIDFYNVLFKKDYQSAMTKIQDLRLDRPRAMYRTLVKFDARDARDDMLDALMNGPVKQALEIPAAVTWGSQSWPTFNVLREDFMKPVTDVVELLLNTTQVEVIVFTGQLDLIVATPGTVMWADRLKYPQKEQYVASNRQGLGVNGILEGYYKTAGRFFMYWVNRAGHMVPADNPAAMDFILQRATGVPAS